MLMTTNKLYDAYSICVNVNVLMDICIYTHGV
jgi:hypothetical protein